MYTQLISTLSLACLIVSPALWADQAPQRKVYWGEEHVHTSWSFDAFAFGNKLTGPEDFYRYAQGQTITHPGGYDVRITRPLDWGAVTEHSEYMGLIQEANNPDSWLSQSSGILSGALRAAVKQDPLLAFKALSVSMATGHTVDTLSDPRVVSPVWQRVVAAADKYNQPGKFTTFAAFEWTSTPDSRNMHRNVFFKDSAKVPEVPYSALESTSPKDLWAWMDNQRAKGNDVLAISHNGNLSSGLMFPRENDLTGEPLDEEWAQARLRNEPLTEVKQGKGQSETSPILSPNDEFANYEVLVWRILGAEGDGAVQFGSYARQAYRDGLAMRQGKGFNPYKFGMAGGADTHSTAVPYRQKNYFGMHGLADASIEARVSGEGELGLNNLWITPAGLTAVWAEENTRDAIFSSLRRKETYATSGVRINLRFFGGWDFTEEMLDKPDWLDSAYARGAPMGGELSSVKGEAPSLAIWATKDPDSANLDRIQVIKGWSKNGQSFEKIYDVAWAGERSPDSETGKVPAIGSTVNLSTGTYENTVGSQELKTVWLDPDFDPGVDAFYYVRVLEIPTPRWTTIQAAQLGRLPPSGAGYSPVIQERAWSSPIWYSAGDGAAEGLTVADLEKQGAVALSDQQIRDLVVGETLRVYNRVSGQTVDILYGAAGKRMIMAVNGEAITRGGPGTDLLHGAPLGYEIKDDRLRTHLEGTLLEVSMFQLGDKYLATRSDEFGFVNYEFERLEK